MKTVPSLIAASALFLVAAPAEAKASEFGVITLRNPTANTVHYQIRCGDGEWVSYSLAPYHYRVHYHPLNELGRAPAPHIRFDYLLNDVQVTNREYQLGFYASWHTGFDNGKKHYFRVSSCGRFLDLYQQ
jgi:hypothetical protein